MTPEQALQNLYQAARSAPLTAAQTLQAAITKLKEEVVAPKEPEKNETK